MARGHVHATALHLPMAAQRARTRSRHRDATRTFAPPTAALNNGPHLACARRAVVPALRCAAATSYTLRRVVHCARTPARRGLATPHDALSIAMPRHGRIIGGPARYHVARACKCARALRTRHTSVARHAQQRPRRGRVPTAARARTPATRVAVRVLSVPLPLRTTRQPALTRRAALQACTSLVTAHLRMAVACLARRALTAAAPLVLLAHAPSVLRANTVPVARCRAVAHTVRCALLAHSRLRLVRASPAMSASPAVSRRQRA